MPATIPHSQLPVLPLGSSPGPKPDFQFPNLFSGSHPTDTPRGHPLSGSELVGTIHPDGTTAGMITRTTKSITSMKKTMKEMGIGGVVPEAGEAEATMAMTATGTAATTEDTRSLHIRLPALIRRTLSLSMKVTARSNFEIL